MALPSPAINEVNVDSLYLSGGGGGVSAVKSEHEKGGSESEKSKSDRERSETSREREVIRVCDGIYLN